MSWALGLLALIPAGAGAVSTALLEVNDPASGEPIRIERATPRLEPTAAGSASGIRQIDAPEGITILVESIGLTGDTAADDDNDFLRIQQAISAAVALGDGTTVRLAGTFDWTEPFANDDWVAADYGILMPGGVADITITATALGNAVILGPGELPDVYYEGFLFGWGTTYQGWTISNLDVRGFEWTIGFFYDGPGGGSVDDFDDLSIVGNRIEIPTDANALAAGNPDESFQNIGIHLAFGDHQTIADNELVLAGDGVSDTANAAFAASVVLQSNSSGGVYEDGLVIADNLIRVTGAQALDPEYVYGIWENFSAHTSNITVSGNLFVAEDPGNDPAVNRQLAFRITSHSSATTTVLYEGNDVVGAHTGFGWLKYSSPYNPPASVEPVVVRGNTLLDCATGIWVRSDNGEGKGTLTHNRFWQTPTGVEVENAVATSVDWWGCNGGPNAPGCAGSTLTSGGALDASSWLELGIENLPRSAEVGAEVLVQAVLRESVGGGVANAFPETEVTFDADPASITSPHDTLAGVAEASYHPAAPGIAHVFATLDATTVGAQLLVTQGGVVTVRSIAETGSTPTSVDNDFTRINDMLQAVDDGVTVRLLGTFDWTEPFAAASWALGSDGVAATGDEYGILPPFGYQGVTLDAAVLGEAVIQGPGDLPGVDLEAFLAIWGGSFHDWTFARLDIRGFDLGLGMFCCSGADVANQYDGVQVLDNRIELATDWNGVVAPDDPLQNIALHLAHGDHQTIQGNEIVIPGTGVSDPGADPANSFKYAASVGLQSNTSGGAVYDGLVIQDNLVRITGAQSAEPERILGIWENAHGHTANITVAGNGFVNENVGNDPATNRQRAFRPTSHSSASTTVLYEGNLAFGANVGIELPYDPPASVEPIVARSNDLVANGTGLLLTQPNQKVDLGFSRLVGNLVGVDAESGTVIAENDWWGCNAGPGAPGCDSVVTGGGSPVVGQDEWWGCAAAPGAPGCDGYSPGGAGTVDASPWLILTLDLDDPTVEQTASTPVTAALVWNSDLVDTSAGGIFVPDGIVADFSATGGAMSPTSAESLAGVAGSTYTAGTTSGSFVVSVTVDGETVNAGVEVLTVLLSDGFESGDFSLWSLVVGGI